MRWPEIEALVNTVENEDDAPIDVRRVHERNDQDTITSRYIGLCTPAFQIPSFVPCDRLFAFRNTNDTSLWPASGRGS